MVCNVGLTESIVDLFCLVDSLVICFEYGAFVLFVIMVIKFVFRLVTDVFISVAIVTLLLLPSVEEEDIEELCLVIDIVLFPAVDVDFVVF